MSVIECDRKNCNEIMCDFQISEVGNICPDCIEDFKRYLYANNINEISSNNEFKGLLRIFLNLYEKDDQRYEDISSQVDDFLNRLNG